MGPAHQTKERTRAGRRSMPLRIAIEVAALGAVAYFFLRERHQFAGLGAIVAHLNWFWVVLAFAAELASIPALAEAQRVVLRAGGTAADRWEMNLVTFASNAISLSVPVGVAFAEGYTFARYRRFGANSAVAAWSELASGAIAFAALAAVAETGAVIAGGGAAPVLLPILSVVLAGSVGAAILFRRPDMLVRSFDWIEGHLRGRLGRWICEATRQVRDSLGSLTGVRPSIRTWVAAAALSALNWMLDVICLALSFQAVGGPIPWGVVLLAFAGTKVVTSIGITPGGIGLVEGGLVATFVAYGTPAVVAGAAVLVYRALTLVGLVGIGWLAVAVLAGRGHQTRPTRP